MSSIKCPMCGSNMTLCKVFNGEVWDCDDDNQECAYQIEVEEDEEEG